jgi:hypothetical protein
MIRGGLRSRMVLDSVRFGVLTRLQAGGWFDATVHDTPPGIRRHQPFRYIARPADWVDDIRPNAIAITPEDMADESRGFGGEVQDLNEIYIDLFAEDDSLGWEVAYDLRDSLLGKSVGAIGPQLDVYDFRQPTPAPFTSVDLDLVEVDRSQGEARTWQRHWFMIHIVVIDEYGDEVPELNPLATTTAVPWTAVERECWDRIQEVEQPTT